MSTNNWASALTSTYAPPPENSLLAQTGDMAIFMDWYCKRQGITHLTLRDLEGPAFEIVKVFYPNVIHLQFQMEECTNFPLIKWLIQSSAAYYPDVGLEQLVPDQFWIEEECKYDIAAIYGISHWWFQRQRFYIDRFSSEGDRRAELNRFTLIDFLALETFRYREQASPDPQGSGDQAKWSMETPRSKVESITTPMLPLNVSK
ncbi:hypothetical protein Tco_0065872 [Tanacetum coccineum]